MATGTIKTMNDAIVTQHVTVASGGSSTTYYKDFTKAVSKSGYTAVGIVGTSWNIAGLYCYSSYITSGTVHVGLTRASGSTALSNVDIYADVLWVRNDLL